MVVSKSLEYDLIILFTRYNNFFLREKVFEAKTTQLTNG
jgi:hypothetical protein